MDRRDVIRGQGKLEDRLQYISFNTVNSDPLTPEGRSKRNFLKYAIPSALVLAVGGAAAWYHFCYKPGQNPPPGTTTQRTTGVNHPPVVPEIKIWPKYINPTTEYLIKLSSDAYDPDNDPLTYIWYVDHKEVSREPNCSIKLPEGDHWIDLDVSDGIETRPALGGNRVTVDPDQIYPVKTLNVKYKGITYFAGPVTSEWSSAPSPSIEEMNEQLDTIHEDLGCNAIIVCGGKDDENKVIECGKLAIGKKFDRIYIQPRYVNSTVEETIENIEKFAPKVRELREMSEAIVYSVGHEFTLETAIIGKTFWERYNYQVKGGGWDKIRSTLPGMFKKIVQVCKENYGYAITYASIPVWEHDLVPWSDPIFESVGVDINILPSVGWTEDWNLSFLDQMKRLGKPVIATDWGVFSYEGADEFGGISPLHLEDRPYDEEAQVRYIEKFCNMLNKTKIDGCFWVQYNEERFEKGHALYNPITLKRKKGFYTYKSFVVV